MSETDNRAKSIAAAVSIVAIVLTVVAILLTVFFVLEIKVL